MKEWGRMEKNFLTTYRKLENVVCGEGEIFHTSLLIAKNGKIRRKSNVGDSFSVIHPGNSLAKNKVAFYDKRNVHMINKMINKMVNKMTYRGKK